MAHSLQEKVKLKGSKFYVFVDGSISDTLIESWHLVLVSVISDERVGSWPIDDKRSESNVHIGSINVDNDWTIESWLRTHNAECLYERVKAKIKKIQKGLTGHKQYLLALKAGSPPGWSGDWPDIDEDGKAK